MRNGNRVARLEAEILPEEEEEDTRPFCRIALGEYTFYDVRKVSHLHFHNATEEDVRGCPELTPDDLELIAEEYQIEFYPLTEHWRKKLWELSEGEEDRYLDHREQMSNVKSGAIPAGWVWPERFRVHYAQQ